MTKAPHYRQLLISLGIKPHFIPKYLSEEQCQFVYFILKPFTAGFIKEQWQLGALLWDKFYHPKLDSLDQFDNHLGHYAALTGNTTALELIKKTRPDKHKKANRAGNTIAHYAALGGHLDVLEWIRKNYPVLMTQTSHQGYTLAHFAAKAGHVHVLQWIKTHYPSLLDWKSKTGSSFASTGALSGDIPTLEWIKLNRPRHLKTRNNQDETLAHGVAASPNPEALVWIKKNCPELIPVLNNKGQSIVHFSILSTEAKQFNLALRLAGYPATLDLRAFSTKLLKSQPLHTMLEQALQSNYTLTELRLPQGIRLTQKSECLLAENKKIKDVIHIYTAFCHEKNKGISRLPRDILFRLFTDSIHGVSERLSPLLITRLFNKIYNGSKPNRFKGAWLVEKQIADLRQQLIQPSSQIQAVVIDSKIDALMALKQLILCADHLTERELKNWYQAHGEFVNQQASGLFRFFKKTLIQSLCTLFALNESTVTNMTNHPDEAALEPEGTALLKPG